jgi:hypothetical protein
MGYAFRFADGKPMPASAEPVRSTIEARKHAQRIFARPMGGQSIRAIAASETLSVRKKACAAEGLPALAIQQAESGPPRLCDNAAQSNARQALENKGIGETADWRYYTSRSTDAKKVLP